MNRESASLTEWLQTPLGRYLLQWETAQLELAVSDIFGYHALQLGLAELDALGSNRMPHRWLAVGQVPDAATGNAPLATPNKRTAALVTDSAALPFAQGSLDLLVLPHTLELSADSHATLREAERVLVPEGRMVITGFNPNSLWAFKQSRQRLYQRWAGQHNFGAPALPCTKELIGYGRLRDWLRLLDFEVESAHFGAYVPAVVSQKWLERFSWMDTLGPRWWPIFGAVYCVVAVKRVRGMRLLEPAKKSRKVPAVAPAAVASKDAATSRPGRL